MSCEFCGDTICPQDTYYKMGNKHFCGKYGCLNAYMKSGGLTEKQLKELPKFILRENGFYKTRDSRSVIISKIVDDRAYGVVLEDKEKLERNWSIYGLNENIHLSLIKSSIKGEDNLFDMGGYLVIIPEKEENNEYIF